MKPINIVSHFKQTESVFRIVFIALTAALTAFFWSLNDNAAAESCDDIYIVWPGSNEGGTFFLELQQDPSTNRFEREGYLQTGTLIKVIRENGQIRKRNLSEGRGEARFAYVEFIGAEGSFGYIKKASIKPLVPLVESMNQSLNCNSTDKLVVPVSPTQSAILYDKPADHLQKPKSIHQFSRSAFNLVYTKEQQDGWGDADHEGIVPFYIVKFSQKQQSGEFQEREALVKVKDEGKTYRFFPVNPARYQKVRVATDESILSKLDRFFSRWLKDIDPDKLARGLNKSCDEEVTIEVELKLDVKAPIPVFRVSTGATATYEIKYEAGYRYALDTYQGFSSDSKSDALKTIRCVDNSTTDWYTQRLAITDIGQKKAAFEAFQDQLEDQLKAYFKKPDTTGFVGLKREKMLALKKFEQGSGMDYFTAFSKLDEYLDDKFFEMAELEKVDELRFRSLMTRLIVDCRK